MQQDISIQGVKPEKGSPFDMHGCLDVSGVDLIDASGQPYRLHGISTHGLQWYPEYVNEATFRFLRDEWGVNAIRLAMYTAEDGYCDGDNPLAFEQIIRTGVVTARHLGMYVIIDWHILKDNDPDLYREDALDFFGRVSAEYSGAGNVLYEICNEPNGYGIDWEHVRSYAEDVIPVIRRNEPDAIILVGTPTWSQDVDAVAVQPVTASDNVMYTLHFYSGTHKQELRDKLLRARSDGTPVMISEFSITDASGSGPLDLNSAREWKELILKENLSCFAWSLSNRKESSALLVPECHVLSGFEDEDLTPAGRWMRDFMRELNAR